MIAAAASLCAGSALVGVSPHVSTLMLGLSVAGVGTIVMAIVGLSVLTSTFPQRAQRSRAFALFAVIAPVVSVVIPLVTSIVIPVAGWRTVTLLWFALGGTVIALARRALPPRIGAAERRELFTPVLAGIALSATALVCSFLTAGVKNPEHNVRAILCAAVAAVSAIALVVVLRASERPTLDLRSLRRRGALSILAAVFTANAVNLFFFVYLFLQFRYHQSLLETAVLLIVPQVTAAIGAIAGGRLSIRFDAWRVAMGALLLAAVASLGALLIDASSSAWMPVLVLSVAAIPIAASVGPITNVFMDLAPADGSGAASSIRSASVNLGIAIAGVIVGTIIFDDLDRDTERNLVAYAQQADAFRLAGACCVVAYLGAAALVALHARRRSLIGR